MGVGYNPKIVTNGLVLALDAGNTKSYPGTGTTWTDLTGRTTGTIFNTPSYSATDGSGSFTFVAASSQYVDLGSVFDNVFSAGITFQAWIKATSYSAFNRVISINGSTNNLQYWIQTNATTGIIEFGTASGVIAQGTSAVGIGNWVNIAGTCFYGASSITLYLNGINNSGGTVLGTPSYTADLGTGYIGRLDAGGANYGNFSISNAQFYNRALSAAEIQQNFYALRGRFGI